MVSLVTKYMPEPRHHALNLADFLPYQLSVTSNAISNRIAQVYRSQFGLRVTEWRVMAVLGFAGALTQRQLTELTLMDKVAVNRACKNLEQRGLAFREPNAQDGRSHLLTLSDDGWDVHDRIVPRARDMESQLLEPLDADEQRLFSQLLHRLREHSNKLGPATDCDGCGTE